MAFIRPPSLGLHTSSLYFQSPVGSHHLINRRAFHLLLIVPQHSRMESANDQNFFNMASNNNFEYGTTPMMMDPSYDVGLQQNAMSTGWLMNDSFYGYEQTVTRQEYLDLAQRVTTLGEQ